MPQYRKMPVELVPALQGDFEYCKRIYFDEMQWILERLRLDRDAQESSFQQQWILNQVRIIRREDANVGWLQLIPQEGALFVAQIFVARPFQRNGIGTEVMKGLLAHAEQNHQPVLLEVVKINPALRLYERLGFRITGEDERKFHMRFDPDAKQPLPLPSGA